MLGYDDLYASLREAGDRVWVESLPGQLAKAFADSSHGDLQRWRRVVEELPRYPASSVDLIDAVRIGADSDIADVARQNLREQLMKLHPWRKGPYRIFGIDIDTEWRSDWKWERLKNGITPLANRSVLDVGCGNGYHCWRMLGAGARLVVGIDPTLLSVMQFQAIRKLYGSAPVYVLPLGIEDVPGNLMVRYRIFDGGVIPQALADRSPAGIERLFAAGRRIGSGNAGSRGRRPPRLATGRALCANAQRLVFA